MRTYIRKAHLQTETALTFEESWPHLAERVARLLAARGVPHGNWDDILQETAIKLFRCWDRIDPEQGPWGLTRTIAIHAIADNALAHRRREIATDVPETPDPRDCAQAGIARHRLSSTVEALSRMSSTDRDVLLAEVGEAPTPELGASALKMRRSRARQRLVALVKQPGSWAGIPRLFGPSMDNVRRLLETRSATITQFLQGSASAGLIVAGTALVSLVGDAVTAPSVPQEATAGGDVVATPLPESGPFARFSGDVLGGTLPDHRATATGDTQRAQHRDVEPEGHDPDRPPKHFQAPGDRVRKDAERAQGEFEALADRGDKDSQRLRRDSERFVDRAEKSSDRLRRDFEDLADSGEKYPE